MADLFNVGSQIVGQVVNSTLGHTTVKLAMHRFQRNYMWEVVLPTIETPADAILSDLVQDIDFGDYEMLDPNTIRFGAFQSNYANFLNGKKFTIDFLETEGGAVARYLSAWRLLMVTTKGLFKPKVNYAKTIVFNYLDSKGVTERTLKFQNAFPLVKLVGKFTYKDSGIAGLTVPFVYDKIIDSAEATGG